MVDSPNPAMDATIRNFAPYDYPAVAAVRNAACPRDPATARQLKDRDDRRPEGIKWGRWVAERGSRVVGMGEYTQSTDLFHPRKFQLIIYVRPRHRGQGIGSMLYDHLVHELQRYEPIAYQARERERLTAISRTAGIRGRLSPVGIPPGHDQFRGRAMAASGRSCAGTWYTDRYAG